MLVSMQWKICIVCMIIQGDYPLDPELGDIVSTQYWLVPIVIPVVGHHWDRNHWWSTCRHAEVYWKEVATVIFSCQVENPVTTGFKPTVHVYDTCIPWVSVLKPLKRLSVVSVFELFVSLMSSGLRSMVYHIDDHEVRTQSMSSVKSNSTWHIVSVRIRKVLAHFVSRDS